MNKRKELRKKIARISYGLLAASAAASLYGLYVSIESIIEISHNASLGRLAVAPYVAELAEGLVLLVHYFLVSKFFIIELKKKVPLNHEGAHELRIIGWETILLPLLVKLVTLLAFPIGSVPVEMLAFEIYELVLGVALIQTGYVIDYATAKIEQGHRYHLICKYLEGAAPDLMKNARDWADVQIIDEHELMKDD